MGAKAEEMGAKAEEITKDTKQDEQKLIPKEKIHKPNFKLHWEFEYRYMRINLLTLLSQRYSSPLSYCYV